jgi:hypothetical protein
LGDSIDPGQIENHFEGGKGKKPIFLVLCITAGLEEPKSIQIASTRLRAKGESPDIRWVSWRKIYRLFKELPSSLNDDRATFLLSSFVETLERENLSGFTPFKKEQFLAVEEATPAFNETIQKWNLLMDETSSILEKHSIKKVYLSVRCNSTEISARFSNKENLSVD